MSSPIADAPQSGGRLSPSLINSSRQFVSILLSVTALAWLTRLLVQREPLDNPWAMQVMLAVGAVLAGCWGIIYCHRVWISPARELQAMLPRVHRGETPFERLNDIEGGPRLLVPAIQELLSELRSQRAAIAEMEIEMRQRVATRASALERTIGTLRHQATRDPLTGLFNRRFFDQYITQSVQRHRKEQKDLCVMMIDVDHFKAVNDTLGHAAGDHLLKSIGGLIRSAIRGEDVAFRYGGDEFGVILHNTDLKIANTLSGRLIEQMSAGPPSASPYSWPPAQA